MVKYYYCIIKEYKLLKILTESRWRTNKDSYKECETIKISREDEIIFIPENCKIIGECVMTKVKSSDVINEIHIPEGIETIEKGAFYYIEAKKLFLPKSIKTIGEEVFTHVLDVEYAGDVNDYLSIDIESKGNSAFIRKMNNYFGVKDFPKKKNVVKEKPVAKKSKAQLAREEERRKEAIFENMKKELPLPNETIPKFDRWKHIAVCATSAFNFFDSRYKDVIDERYLSKEDLLSLGKIKNPIFLNYCVGAWCKKPNEEARPKHAKPTDAISVYTIQAFPTSCEEIFKVRDGCEHVKVGEDGLIHAYFAETGVCEIAWNDCKMERFTSRCKYADIPFRLHLSKDDDVERYGIEPAFFQDELPGKYICSIMYNRGEFMTAKWGKYNITDDKADTEYNFSFKVGKKQYYLTMSWFSTRQGDIVVVDYNIGKDDTGYYFDVILRVVVGDDFSHWFC